MTATAKYRVDEIKRTFSLMSGTSRVRAIVAHVLADAPKGYDVWVDDKVIVIRPTTPEAAMYLADVVRQLVWWLKQWYFVVIRHLDDGMRIEYFGLA